MPVEEATAASELPAVAELSDAALGAMIAAYPVEEETLEEAVRSRNGNGAGSKHGGGNAGAGRRSFGAEIFSFRRSWPAPRKCSRIPSPKPRPRPVAEPKRNPSKSATNTTE